MGIYINADLPKAQEWVLAFSVLNESWSCLMVDKFQKQNCQSDEEEEEEKEQLS
jgi:hypothetical protein